MMSTEPKTVHIDLPRSTLDSAIDWTVIESIKNGQFQSNKYSSQRICWIEKPHIILNICDRETSHNIKYMQTGT